MENTELQKCHRDRIAAICREYDNKAGELINVLHKCQEEFGYLPEAVQKEVAHHLKMPVAKVYGVVTFYSFFTMQPKGKYNISLCLGTACYVRGAETVLEALKQKLGLEVGGVTADGRFSLDCLRCVGACGLAPVMMIGDKVYGKLEVGMLDAILAQYE